MYHDVIHIPHLCTACDGGKGCGRLIAAVKLLSFQIFMIQMRMTSKFIQFFFVHDHRYTCDKINIKIQSVVLCEVADRQINKQKDKRQVPYYINFLVEVTVHLGGISAKFSRHTDVCLLIVAKCM